MVVVPPHSGLAVKERKWGKTGYNKVSTPVYVPETTPTGTSEESTDSGPKRDGEGTGSKTHEEETTKADSFISSVSNLTLRTKKKTCKTCSFLC